MFDDNKPKDSLANLGIDCFLVTDSEVNQIRQDWIWHVKEILSEIDCFAAYAKKTPYPQHKYWEEMKHASKTV